MGSKEAALAIREARLTGQWIADASGFPSTADEGQAAQDELVADPGELGRVIGWKARFVVLLNEGIRRGPQLA